MKENPMNPQPLTSDGFLALVAELKAYAHAHPLNILERVRSGLGAPVEHRRDFQYRDHEIRVLLTEDLLGLGPGARCAEHLSVMNLACEPFPETLRVEILDAFFPGCDPANLLRVPSALPGCVQYIRLTPRAKEVE